MTMGSPATTESNTKSSSEKITNNSTTNGSGYSENEKKMQKSDSFRPSNRIDCPCHNFTALSKILDAISAEDRTRTESMIEWLNGTTDQVAIREKKILSCGKRFQCRYRYGTSFAILRAIRDVCTPFQTGASVTTTGANDKSVETSRGQATKNPSSLNTKAHKNKDISGPANYDQSFPPLQTHPGFSNILVPPSRKKTQVEKAITSIHTVNEKSSEKVPSTTTVINTLQARKKKPKQRIQPQLMSVTTSTTTPTATLHQSLAANFLTSTKNDAYNSSNISPPSRSKQNTEQSTGIGIESSQQPTVAAMSSSSTVINTLEVRKKKPKQRVQPQLTPVNSAVATNSTLISIPHTGMKTPPRTSLPEINLSHQSIGKSGNNTVSEVAVEQMNRLVDIYITLIHNMLVPSTPLEIHLLLELLSIDATCSISMDSRDQSIPNSKGDNESVVTTATSTGLILFFQPIFCGPERCIEFARSALTKLQKRVLQRLSPFLVKSLLRDSIFVRQCPTIANDLNTFLLENTTAADWETPSPESITGTHAMFSLPFEPDRDSRHNFKTSAEIAMYQNRETTRDAFLSELRVFITAKSKVFLPQQVDKVRETAQYESRKIIANISSHNILWFAQFFCELLLQVGLAPVDEMDQELLKIAADDRDKLQKLHKRFTKKTPFRSSQTSRAGFASTTAPSGRRNHNERYRSHHDGNTDQKSWAASAFHEALQYFPGYQEFFFIFLYSVNSYTFGVHLLHQVVNKISGMMSNQSPSGLEKRTLELALLGRFLGFLAFSPNWYEEGIDLNKLKPFVSSLDHGLNVLQSIGLSLSKVLEEAWEGGYAILTIPWITELLKMSKWDSISQSSMNYRQILANLRHIQNFTSQPSPGNRNMISDSNLQVLSFHLETFFNDTFSLPKLTSLPDAIITLIPPSNPDSLDNQKIGFSTVGIYASSPHMEDLCDMIMHLNKKMGHREMKAASTKPRQKLRPSIVSTTVGTEVRSYIAAESPGGKMTSPLSKAAWKEAPLDNSAQGKKTHAQNKLIEGFYHQHRDLKEICDFAVEHTLKSLSVDDMNVFVAQAFGEFNIRLQSSETEIEEVQMRAMQLSRDFIRNNLTNNLTKSLQLFCHSGVQRRVIDVATSLSTGRGMESSQTIVRGLILSATKIALKDMESNKKMSKTEKEESKTEIDKAIEDATSSIRNLYSEFCSDFRANMKLIKEGIHYVEVVTKSILIPRENLLRDFFESVLNLESVATISIVQVLETSTPESWTLLRTFYTLLELLALISGYWRNRIPSLFGEELLKSIENSEIPSLDERKTLLQQLKLTQIVPASPEIANDIANDSAGSKYTGIIAPMAIQFND